MKLLEDLTAAEKQFIREIRYLPDRMQYAYTLFEGRHFPIRSTNRVENGRTKRNNTHAIDYFRLEGLDDV